MPVTRIDYRDGTYCDKAFCKPKGYVERPAPKRGSVRRPLTITVRRERVSKWTANVVHVRFKAPVAITDSQTMYLLEGRFPASPKKECRRVVFYAPTNRNVTVGQSDQARRLHPPALHGAPVRAGPAGRHHLHQRQAEVARRRPLHPPDPLNATAPPPREG